MITGIIICFIYVVMLSAFNKISGVKYTELVASENNIVRGLFIPVGVATILLTVFATMRGYIPDVFTYSPTVTGILFWIVPILIIAGILFRATHWHFDKFTKKGIIFVALSTLFVGFSEELLVRGILVHLLTTAGYSILIVGILSSLIFGLLHFVNYFNGQDIKTTGGQMVATTLIGFNFFILLIITGSLWVPIVLHALHDLSLLLLGGEINKGDGQSSKQELAVTMALFAVAPITLLVLWLK